MQQEMARTGGNQRLALHFIDLDGFKNINDVMGHSTGDKFLIGAAERLLTLKRDSHVVARLGGDEFAILQTNLVDKADAANVAAEVGAILREPLVLDGHRFLVGASIGTAIHPLDGVNVEELLRCADIAMYKAKRDGGDRHEFYTADLMLHACQSAQLDAELRLAIEHEDFVLHYQPQICLQSGKLTGVEALVRWRKSDGQLVYPGGFLPRAEESGAIVAISEWVLRAACKQAANWRRRGFPSLRMGVNLSPVQFHGRGLPLNVACVLDETGLDPRFLELELTESILVRDAEQAIGQLQQLRDLGVFISIDDFGTGFSSLSYVKRLPVDRLKIDQCFVRNVISDPSDRAIIASVIGLGHSLRMKVLAEGIETIEQLEYLRAAGCDSAQGYYIGRPMSAAQFEEFMLEGQSAAVAS
jgi:diguanylate cyclase (GGDEF)-like protein